MHFLLVWLLSAMALIVAAYILPSVEIESFGTAMIAAALIGLLNATLGFLLRSIVFRYLARAGFDLSDLLRHHDLHRVADRKWLCRA